MVFSRLLWVVEVGVLSLPLVSSMTDRNRMPTDSHMDIHHINHIRSDTDSQIHVISITVCWSIWICLENRWTFSSNSQGWCVKGNPSISRLTFFQETTIFNRSNWFIASSFWYVHSNAPSKEKKKAFGTNPKTHPKPSSLVFQWNQPTFKHHSLSVETTAGPRAPTANSLKPGQPVWYGRYLLIFTVQFI